MQISPKTIASIRFGYGFHPRQAAPGSPDDLLAQIAVGAAEKPRYPSGGVASRLQTFRALRDELTRLRERTSGQARRDVGGAYRRALKGLYLGDSHDRFAQSVLSPNSFYERLVVFWSDHFTVSAQKNAQTSALVPLMEATAIRPHVGGRFNIMLREAALHPAMVLYLDQSRSVGPNSRAGRRRDRGLNENLAREILELHTLGVNGGYTQSDVREFAELLTGLRYDAQDLETEFTRGRAEPGAEVLLGRLYGGNRARIEDIYQALDDLASHPATALHLSRKLATHFISDNPPRDLVSRMTSAYLSTGGQLMALYDTMLRWPGAWSDMGLKIKQPYDLIVSAFRGFGADAAMTAPEPRRAARVRRAGAMGAMNDMNAMNVMQGAGGTNARNRRPFQEMSAADYNALLAAVARPHRASVTVINGVAPSGGGAYGRYVTPQAAPTMSLLSALSNPQTRAERRRNRLHPNRIGPGAMNKMDQRVWSAPGPDGWPEDPDAWINGRALAARLKWADLCAERFIDHPDYAVDPRAFLELTLADFASETTRFVVRGAGDKREGVALTLASPEFNRR